MQCPHPYRTCPMSIHWCNTSLEEGSFNHQAYSDTKHWRWGPHSSILVIVLGPVQQALDKRRCLSSHISYVHQKPLAGQQPSTGEATMHCNGV